MNSSLRRRLRKPRFRIAGIVAALFVATLLVPAPAQAAVTGIITTSEGNCLTSVRSTYGSYSLKVVRCDGSPGQKWTGADDGTVRAENRCLVPTQPWSISTSPLNTSTCLKPLQKWDLRNGALAVQGQNWCAARSSSGAVRLAGCSSAPEQQWNIVYDGAPTTPPTTPPPTTPPPTTPPPTTPSPGNPSGVAPPRGDLPGWKQIFVDDFTQPSTTGSWGNQCDPTRVVYTGSNGQKWRTYPSCYKDTYQKRPYRPDAVLSTHDSVLDYHLRNVDGQPAGASVSPVINGAGQNQTYGRYTARFKVDSPTLSEFYVAWLLWPQSERWPADGEFDFPEGSLASTAGGFHHYAGAGSCVGGCQDIARNIGARFTDWHTYTIEWSPGRIKYILDNTVVLDSTKWVPSGPMRWELQTETNGNGKNNGHLLLDWVAVYSWAG